jgi:tRNA A37 N6-isopentenylltransferase MiaA
MDRTFGIVDALQMLTPGAQWVLSGDEYSGLEWMSEDIDQPTEEELLEEAARLQEEYDALEYQRLRAPEYPPIEDYVDGIVKGDQDQIDAYIAACIAVKEKYPKPSV